MENLINELLERNKKYSKEQIEFIPYCIKKMDDRNVTKEQVISLLFSNEKPYYSVEQKVPHKGEIEIRYKMIYKISSRYSLIIIVSYYENNLKVINVIKTSKGAEKQWRNKLK